MLDNPISFLRKVAIAEAISFLLLLFIAMPLKHFAGIPEAVRIVGLVHGILFLVFCYALMMAWSGAKWPISRAIMLLIASVIPFVPFFVDKRLRQWEGEYPPAKPEVL